MDAALVRITVITWKRSHLLQRALSSVLAQTFVNWRAEVINDDPSDPEPARIVAAFGDARVTMFEPTARRGATANFNLAFRPGPERYGSVLEDDNWWEPEFLAELVHALEARPSAPLITANERVWQEQGDGTWTRTSERIRPERDAIRPVPLRLEDKCGASVLANSALLYRLAESGNWMTPPEIPVDVTEHYRERRVRHPFLMHDRVLVNFGRTRQTARSHDAFDWNVQQVLLIGSVFALVGASERPALADRLLANARCDSPLQVNALALTGRFISEARDLWTRARVSERARVVGHLMRHRGDHARYRRLRRTHAAEWTYLQTGWMADALRGMVGTRTA